MDNDREVPDNKDILLRQWETVIHYWASDNSTVLSWSTGFILLNSILFGFLAIASGDSVVPPVVLKYFSPALGVLVNIIWFLGVSRFFVYLRHYHDLIMDIQGEFPLLRFQDSKLLNFGKLEFASTKPLLRFIPVLFFVFWLAILIIQVIGPYLESAMWTTIASGNISASH